jgi:molybdenum cofactor cytidylyltransferase
MTSIGGMVLAAGLSERMAGPVPKQMLTLDGAAMVAVTVSNAEASNLDRVVVVTGYRAAAVKESLGGGRAEVFENRGYRSGNMSSFRVGAEALDGCDAFVVLLADMPGLSTAMIDQVVAKWHADHPWAAVSSYDDGLAHPLLFSSVAVTAAVEMEGPKGLWRFLDEAPAEKVHQIVFPGSKPPDINTKEDYERLLRQNGTWS